MQIRQVTDEVAVAGQIRPEDVAQIAAAGFRAIICNRPDGEEQGQPDFASIAAAAAAAGLAVRDIPVRNGAMTMAHVEAVGSAIAELPKPVLAYCRSGTRSITLWSLSEAGKRPPAEIVELAARAGYDMSGLFANR